MTGDGAGSKWLREQIRQRKNPDERAGRRDDLTRRLFRNAPTEHDDDKPDNGPEPNTA